MPADNDSIITLIGFIMVLVVGLNLVFALSGMTAKTSATTGFIAADFCKGTADGIKCADAFFPSAEKGCINGQVSVCTNTCTLENTLTGAGKDCPEICTNVCVTQRLATQLAIG